MADEFHPPLSASVAAQLTAAADLLTELATYAAPEHRDNADTIAIAIGQYIDAVIDEVRLETAAAVSRAAVELARAEARVAAAEAARADSWNALCDSVATAPIDAFGPTH